MDRIASFFSFGCLYNYFGLLRGWNLPLRTVVHGGDRLAEVKSDGWLPVNYSGEVRWVSEKAVG